MARRVLLQASSAPAANDDTTVNTKVAHPPAKLRTAKRSVHRSFGKGVLSLSILPAIASVSPWIDKELSALFLFFSIVLAIVGAFYIDRSNHEKKALIKAISKQPPENLG